MMLDLVVVLLLSMVSYFNKASYNLAEYLAYSTCICNAVYLVITFLIVGVAITTHPMDQISNLSGDVNFTCEASGSSPISYRWFNNGNELVDDPGHIMGSNTSTVIITSVTVADWGVYTCEVTNIVKNIISNRAILSGECIAMKQINECIDVSVFIYLHAFLAK